MRKKFRIQYVCVLNELFVAQIRVVKHQKFVGPAGSE